MIPRERHTALLHRFADALDALEEVADEARTFAPLLETRVAHASSTLLRFELTDSDARAVLDVIEATEIVTDFLLSQRRIAVH